MILVIAARSFGVVYLDMHPGLLFAMAFLSLPLVFAAPEASACNVCHSKNPKMVKMHQALEYKDCFTCHLNGLKSSSEEKQLQRETDARCVRCHKKNLQQENLLLK